MDSSLIIIGALLILGVIAMLFRVSRLVDVLRGSHQNRADGSNGFNAVMFPVFGIVMFGLFFWYSDRAQQYYLPAPSSAHGADIDFMFWLTMGVITLVFIATHILLFSFPYIYQYKENRKATFYPDNHKLELIWTVIPGITLSLLVFTGFKVWTEVTQDAPQGHEVVEIVGKQFNWILRYPGKDGELGKYNFKKIDDVNSLGIDMNDKRGYDDFMPQEIHIPVGKPVKFNIRARDVLHSVFAFHFRQKMDAVPGMPTSFWFTPTKTTADMRAELKNPNFNYEIACTEVCGRGHFGMKVLVVVDEPEDYEKWKAGQQGFLAKNPDYISQVPEANMSYAKTFLPAEKQDSSATASTPAMGAAAAGF